MNDDDQDDMDAFRKAVEGVKPLVHNRADLNHPKPKAEAKQRILDEQRVLQESLESHIEEFDLEKGDELIYLRPGIQKSILRKLKKGQFTIQDEIDLHGSTKATAKHAIDQFILESRKSKAHCIKIIHGKGYGSPKGKPVLKNHLNKWLQQRDDVIAFCSAPLSDGGTGAVYVLLKKLK